MTHEVAIFNRRSAENNRLRWRMLVVAMTASGSLECLRLSNQDPVRIDDVVPGGRLTGLPGNGSQFGIASVVIGTHRW